MVLWMKKKVPEIYYNSLWSDFKLWCTQDGDIYTIKMVGIDQLDVSELREHALWEKI